MHESGNISINANFVFPYICSFLLHLHHLLFVNVNFNLSCARGLYFKVVVIIGLVGNIGVLVLWKICENSC